MLNVWGSYSSKAQGLGLPPYTFVRVSALLCCVFWHSLGKSEYYGNNVSSWVLPYCNTSQLGSQLHY